MLLGLIHRKTLLRAALAPAALATLFFTPFLYGQGILSVTPSASATTSAGTGSVGYSGDNSAATSATLASPSAVTYDAAGNLFIADANNHVVREVVKSNGNIVTVAGSGAAGFSGDNGAATSALLDTPTGVAVDGSGNLYIADSHNNRIRKVSGGTITTIAGTGVAGFSGEGSAATSAMLALPSAVAVDGSGNVYIADTNNNRIRKIAGTTISTVAGNGEQLFAGDGSAATAASLDSPTGVAVDAAGNIYIADRHNQRIRVVSAGGTISTLAGSGAVNFSGADSGDGASATAASLAKPTGVSVDASGNVYIADTNNNRVRKVSNGAIGAAVGTGVQGFDGDGGSATAATLDAPKAVGSDASGNLAVADTNNQRVRATALPVIGLGSSAVGVASNTQSVTLANTGTASISVASIAFDGTFATVAGGSCSATPITLAAGASCTQNIAFIPTSVGAVSGSVTFGGSGVVAQKILLTGTGVQATTTTTLVSSAPTPFINEPITFTATVAPEGLGNATGLVSFYDGALLLGTGTLTSNVATFTTTALASGTHVITAVYAGDVNFGGSTSNALTQLVGDFNFTIQPDPTNPAGSGFDITVVPGQAGVFTFRVAPLNGPFTFPITLSATGLPPGATATFNPSTVTLGGNPAIFTMTVQTAKTSSALHRLQLFGGSSVVLGLLLLPFAGRMRKGSRKMRPLVLGLLFVLSLGGMLSMSGCGSDSGFFGQQQKKYTINVIATAQGAGSANLQHVATVTLTVQ